MSAHLTFPKGGVHPPEAKELTEKLAVETMPLPAELELILGQHIGAPCAPVVKRKQEIAEGELVAEVKRGLGVPLHAPAAGSIKAIGTSAHPIRVSAPSVTIKTDPEAEAQTWEELLRVRKRFTWPDRPVLFDHLEKVFLDLGYRSTLMHLNLSPGLLRIKRNAGLK